MLDDDFIKESNRHEREMHQIKARERRDRREFWMTVLAGVAGVVIILGIITGIVVLVEGSSRRHTQTVNACIESGGTWAALNGVDTCVHMEVSQK